MSIVRRKDGVKRGAVVNTSQSLQGLDRSSLVKLRKQAQEMGLRDFAARISAQLAALKSASGSLSERGALHYQMTGMLPGALALRGGFYLVAGFDDRGEFAVMEIERGALLPASAEDRERGVLWVHEKSGRAGEEEKRSLRAEGDLQGMEARAARIEALERAARIGCVVEAVLFSRYKRRDEPQYTRLEALVGRVALANPKTGAYKVEFSKPVTTTKESQA